MSKIETFVTKKNSHEIEQPKKQSFMKDHFEILDTFNDEQLQKFNKSYDNAVNKFEKYAKIHLDDILVFFNRGLKKAEIGQNYISFENNFVVIDPMLIEYGEQELERAIIHELIHSLLIGSKIKDSNKIHLVNNGFDFRIRKPLKEELVRKIYDRNKTISIGEVFKTIDKYGRMDVRELYKKLMQKPKPVSKDRLNRLESSLRSSLNPSTDQQFAEQLKYLLMVFEAGNIPENVFERKSIGTKLNESLVDYLAIKLTTDDTLKRQSLRLGSGYLDEVNKVSKLINWIANHSELSIENVEDKFVEAAKDKAPYKIIKLINQTTGVVLKPRELFELDFEDKLNSSD